MALLDVEVVPQLLMGRACRLVESQEYAATLSVTDTLEEQTVLEDLIDQVKPDRHPETNNLHYLLATPFRYPPLWYGSRFGTREERGIFYAARRTATCLAEAAFYRFHWWYDMEAMPAKPIRSHHTLFTVKYRSECGVDLTTGLYQTYQEEISHPAQYQRTQDLGRQLRKENMNMVIYGSARCREGGQNVGLFAPSALHSHGPEELRQVICHARKDVVFFLAGDEQFEFGLQQFIYKGKLPRPAS